MNWKNKFPWLIFSLVALFLGAYVLFIAKVQLAGDIAEYYGVTESVVNHFGLNLTDQDRTNLEKVLHPAYFEMSGYYLDGVDQNRYPVHFWFYSLLAVPFRLILSQLNLDPRKSLLIVNWLSVVTAVALIFKRYLTNSAKRLALLVAVFTGALMSFLVWPGPDLWYLSLLLIVPFAFFNQDYWLAVVLTIIASWHSQPLVVLAAGLTAYAVFTTVKKQLKSRSKKNVIIFLLKNSMVGAVLGLIALIPYFYNLAVFGVLTPWTQLQDGWTIIRGFGLHNASLWKFYEQWLDLNIGLFWYASAVFILALLGIFKRKFKKEPLIALLFLSLITAFSIRPIRPGIMEQLDLVQQTRSLSFTYFDLFCCPGLYLETGLHIC